MNVEPHTVKENLSAASCASVLPARGTGSTAREAAFSSMQNEFKIGDRVSGFGVLASVQGTVVGISENPPAVEVKWDNAALIAPGRAGRWEDLYNVQKIDLPSVDLGYDYAPGEKMNGGAPLRRTIEQLNADYMLDDVRVIWNSGTVLLTTRDGKILTVLAITSDIQGKIARWLDKNNMRCTQIHDGKIWL